jgi:hypothetical protein
MRPARIPIYGLTLTTADGHRDGGLHSIALSRRASACAFLAVLSPPPLLPTHRHASLRDFHFIICGNALLARTEVIEEVQLLPVNDHLAPAQFDELVLGQEAEESLLMPDE